MGFFSNIKNIFSSHDKNFTNEIKIAFIFSGLPYPNCTPTQYAIYSLGNYYFNRDDAEFLNSIVLSEKSEDKEKKYTFSFDVANSGKGYREVTLEYCLESERILFNKDLNMKLLEKYKKEYFKKFN